MTDGHTCINPFKKWMLDDRHNKQWMYHFYFNMSNTCGQKLTQKKLVFQLKIEQNRTWKQVILLFNAFVYSSLSTKRGWVKVILPQTKFEVIRLLHSRRIVHPNQPYEPPLRYNYKFVCINKPSRHQISLRSDENVDKNRSIHKLGLYINLNPIVLFIKKFFIIFL